MSKQLFYKDDGDISEADTNVTDNNDFKMRWVYIRESNIFRMQDALLAEALSLPRYPIHGVDVHSTCQGILCHEKFKQTYVRITMYLLMIMTHRPINNCVYLLSHAFLCSHYLDVFALFNMMLLYF